MEFVCLYVSQIHNVTLNAANVQVGTGGVRFKIECVKRVKYK